MNDRASTARTAGWGTQRCATDVYPEKLQTSSTVDSLKLDKNDGTFSKDGVALRYALVVMTKKDTVDHIKSPQDVAHRRVIHTSAEHKNMQNQTAPKGRTRAPIKSDVGHHGIVS